MSLVYFLRKCAIHHRHSTSITSHYITLPNLWCLLCK